MKPLQILERYFNAFIGLDDPKHFFIGMSDYLNYGDGMPEYDWITTQISAMSKPLLERLDEQNKVAMGKVRASQDEIISYITKKQIGIPEIHNSLQHCQAILDGHVHSDTPAPYLLHLSLYDIIRVLYAVPIHKDFASKYIVFSERDKTQPREYLPLKELDDLMETKKEFDEGREDAVWGIQAHLYNLREVVNRGREIGRGIRERLKNRERDATSDWLNFGVLMGEWEKVKDRRPERDPVFFNPKKVRPQMQRFHMHVVAHFAEARVAVASTKPRVESDDTRKEVIKLAPEFYGIGIDLKALWKKWFRQ